MSDSAGQPSSVGPVEPGGPTGSARPAWLPVAIGAVALVAVVALAFVLLGGSDDDGTEVDTAAGTSSTTVTAIGGGTVTTVTTEDDGSAPTDETTVPTDGGSSPSVATNTTVPSGETTVPPSSGTTDTADPGGPVDCGSITPSGWPTTTAPNPAVTTCLVDAFDAGTPATLLEVSYGAPDGGGDPAYRHEIRYEVIGERLLRVTTDWATATAPDAPDTVTVEECTELAPDTMWPAPGNCTVVSET
ncbi:MAG: hypothetical protein MUF83_13135 [Acidimicrobiales bacterium]|jgi:hypothetical protein|nr:hypothetical protein [Acidimicrobiales bacterium]